MRIRDRRAEDVPEINLVPLIDVILVLIIFFVITTTFDARSVLKLELPRATGERNDAQGTSLSLLTTPRIFFVGSGGAAHRRGTNKRTSSKWPATTAPAPCCCAPTRARRGRR